jgi:hypothetical protein
MPLFTRTSASIPGHTHRKMGYNNQDALRVIDTHPHCLIAVVADGCGSKPSSEVGAQLAVNFVAEEIARMIDAGENWRENIQQAHLQWAERLVSAQRAEERERFVHDFMLYTLLGVVVEEAETTLFHGGDGVIVINGQVQVIDQGNRPAYLNYALTGKETRDITYQTLPTAAIDSLLVGTDGVEDLRDLLQSEGREGHRSLAGLCESPGMYRDEVALSKFIFQASLDGKLLDDTSLVMLRRGLR